MNIKLNNWQDEYITELENCYEGQLIKDNFDNFNKYEVISILNDFLWAVMHRELQDNYNMNPQDIVKYTEDYPPDNICFFDTNKNGELYVTDPHSKALSVYNHYIVCINNS